MARTQLNDTIDPDAAGAGHFSGWNDAPPRIDSDFEEDGGRGREMAFMPGRAPGS